jgi:DNA-directed RNA polymerase specialized sigma24 family protein
MEQVLQGWGAWVDSGGRTGNYPRTSPLHPTWMPPSASAERETPRAGRNFSDVHAQIAELPPKLRDSLLLHYVLKLPPKTHGERVGCTPSAVSARILRAHRALAAALQG